MNRPVQTMFGPLRRFAADRRALAFLFAATPLLAAHMPNGIVIPLVTGVVGTVLRADSARALLRPPKALTAMLVLFFVWAAASAIWSIDPAASLLRTFRVALLAACGLVIIQGCLRLSEEERRFARLGLLVGTALLLAQLLFEVATGGAVTGLLHPSVPEAWEFRAPRMQTGATIMAIVVWPSAMVAARRISVVVAVALVGGAIAAALLIDAGAAMLSLIVGALVFAVSAFAPNRAAAFAAFGMALAVLAAPVIPSAVSTGPWMRDLPQSVRFSVYHRVKIWQFVAERIAERPVAGWGMDASRNLPGADRPVDINEDLGYSPPVYPVAGDSLPLHPHNVALQLWLELGAIGAALGALLFAWAANEVRRSALAAVDKAVVLAGFMAATTVASLSWGVWQSWWQSMLWITAATLIVVARRTAQTTTPDPRSRAGP